MQDIGSEQSMLTARIIGAVCGALVSFAYMMPKGAREAGARAVAGSPAWCSARRSDWRWPNGWA